MIRRLLWLTCLVALSASTLLAQAPNPVRSEIAVEEAWMGQDVRLTVTLLSPGPFSGTAVFQIPEIPNTLIVKHGNPVVGSETVSGESMITERHEFSIYTQQVGKVEIPAIPVDYESKETFLGDAVARSGKTSVVSFNSKRPPGTEDFAFVVSSATTKISQSWTPGNVTEFKAGDVLSRSITREPANHLSRYLFRSETPEHRWDGTPLLLAFQEELHRRKRRSSRSRDKESLPPLNPRIV